MESFKTLLQSDHDHIFPASVCGGPTGNPARIAAGIRAIAPYLLRLMRETIYRGARGNKKGRDQG
jgi:hypothetical protein